jgi:hypothetical protein
MEMRIDRTAFKKVKIEETENDFRYWQTQSYEKRLETLESIRNEYIEWKYGNKQGFQRVYSITKQK